MSIDRVVDGDSIEVVVGGEPLELRLQGFNAPELYRESDDGTDVQTCGGLAGRDAVNRIVDAAETIELVVGEQDRFGRTLGDLAVDGRSLVEMLITDGHGLATGDQPDHRLLMRTAAADQRGVWGDECGQPESGRLSIGLVQVDAPGNDRYNLIEEFVEIRNVSSGAVELNGWVLRDDTTGHRFPLAGQLDPGSELTVITGGDPDDSDVSGTGTVFLGESFPVWSNEWETIILVDPNGVFADWRFVADGDVLLE